MRADVAQHRGIAVQLKRNIEIVVNPSFPYLRVIMAAHLFDVATSWYGVLLEVFESFVYCFLNPGVELFVGSLESFLMLELPYSGLRHSMET